MSFDYIQAAGEVLAKTGDGGDAFEAYCAMRMVRLRGYQTGEAIHLMRDRLKGNKGMPAEHCAEAFRRALPNNEWVSVSN